MWPRRRRMLGVKCLPALRLQQDAMLGVKCLPALRLQQDAMALELGEASNRLPPKPGALATGSE
jgi:hypothetical protein